MEVVAAPSQRKNSSSAAATNSWPHSFTESSSSSGTNRPSAARICRQRKSAASAALKQQCLYFLPLLASRSLVGLVPNAEVKSPPRAGTPVRCSCWRISRPRFRLPAGGGRATDPDWTERRLVPLAHVTASRLTARPAAWFERTFCSRRLASRKRGLHQKTRRPFDARPVLL